MVEQSICHVLEGFRPLQFGRGVKDEKIRSLFLVSFRPLQFGRGVKDTALGMACTERFRPLQFGRGVKGQIFIHTPI